MLTVEQARARLLSGVAPLATETLCLMEAHHRVAAESISATRALPPFDNSAMDGYAVRAIDTEGATESQPRRLPVTEVISAGNVAQVPLRQGTAMRIFTGAPIPEGANAVVMQEQTTVDGDDILVHTQVRVGKHVRRAGEDVSAGDVLVHAGDHLGAGELAIVATQGRSWLKAFTRPRVAIVPTGDELVEVDEMVPAGHIVNSNGVMLAAQVRDAGGEPLRMPIARDDPQQLEQAFARAAQSADVIIACGGVSVGEFDLVRDVLERCGSIGFWKVAMKPGKPLAFGKLHGRPFFGLPGNPVSAFVCFELFARPFLRALGGHKTHLRPAVEVKLNGTIKPNAERREFLRASLQPPKLPGTPLVASPLGKQGSGHQSSLLGVDCLLDVPPGLEPLTDGSRLSAIVLRAPTMRSTIESLP